MTSRQFRFESLQTSDGEVVHGLSQGEGARLAVHLHGTWGNFYENAFALGLAATYVQHGYTYVSLNTPGHDGGSLHEDFDSSLDATADSLMQLATGMDRIVLQGHSLGALKIIQLMLDARYEPLVSRVSALVLLSPFDLAAFYGGAEEKERRRRRRAATSQIKKAGPTVLLDTATFDVWPIGARTFLSATEDGGKWDLLPTRNGTIGRLSELHVPLFVAIGGSDFAATPDPATVATLLKRELSNASVHLIDGAPHNFAGCEPTLTEQVTGFLRGLVR